MSTLKGKKCVVVGLGKTGMSCVNYLLEQGCDVVAMDSSQNPSLRIPFDKSYPHVKVILGALDYNVLTDSDLIIVSPGVSLDQPVFQKLIEEGKEIVGDVELFLREITAPVIAITGSNGKTSVTQMVGVLLERLGKSVVCCGNIGAPVLDFLHQSEPDYYVIELSSFQLETISSLRAKVAVVLNITPDHIDRHKTMAVYTAMKQRIYDKCEIAVLNLDEKSIWEHLHLPQKKFYFSSQKENIKHAFHFKEVDRKVYLAYQDDLIVQTDELAITNRHGWKNILAVLAIGFSLDFSLEDMATIVKDFKTLPHRCQHVATVNGVSWINDSKGTNVGATIAAIESTYQKSSRKLILILGGDSKQSDLSALKPVVKTLVSSVYIYGKDADLFESLLAPVTSTVMVRNLEEAVSKIAMNCSSGDIVLLSPACSSLDMFDNYQHRGDTFVKLVEGLVHEKDL